MLIEITEPGSAWVATRACATTGRPFAPSSSAGCCLSNLHPPTSAMWYRPLSWLPVSSITSCCWWLLTTMLTMMTMMNVVLLLMTVIKVAMVLMMIIKIFLRLQRSFEEGLGCETFVKHDFISFLWIAKRHRQHNHHHHRHRHRHHNRHQRM